MLKHRVLSFKYALEGIWLALKDEPNLKFHLLAAALAIILGIHFQITSLEWLVLILVIGLVLSLELTNTALEEIISSFTQDKHPGAKKAKDVAAGAVLVVSLMALVLGIMIFLPYFLNQ